MKQNIGKADKIIRLVLGLAIAALFTNSCPLYLIFKLNTKNGKQT